MAQAQKTEKKDQAKQPPKAQAQKNEKKVSVKFKICCAVGSGVFNAGQTGNVTEATAKSLRKNGYVE
jgi:hypothetical protein